MYPHNTILGREAGQASAYKLRRMGCHPELLYQRNNAGVLRGGSSGEKRGGSNKCDGGEFPEEEVRKPSKAVVLCTLSQGLVVRTKLRLGLSGSLDYHVLPNLQPPTAFGSHCPSDPWQEAWPHQPERADGRCRLLYLQRLRTQSAVISDDGCEDRGGLISVQDQGLTQVLSQPPSSHLN